MSRRYIHLLAALTALLMSQAACAAILQHTFTGTGTNGEVAQGSFSWDSDVIGDGDNVVADCPTDDFQCILSFELTISGGNVIGGSTDFLPEHCDRITLRNSPDFSIDINFFDCDNGSNTLNGVLQNTSSLNGGPSELTWTPGTTSPVPIAPVPVNASLLLGMLSLSIGLFGWQTLRRRRFSKLQP